MQRYIGLFTAVIMTIAGICMLSESLRGNVSFWYTIDIWELTILSLVYSFALALKMCKLALMVYRIWWITMSIIFGFFFLASPIVIRKDSFDSFIIVLSTLTWGAIPVALITLLWWMGLNGLNRISQTQENTK